MVAYVYMGSARGGAFGGEKNSYKYRGGASRGKRDSFI
jgi:hypothetical protein